MSQTDAVVVPDRVAFVSLKTGKVFFDCHPAEARLAIDHINQVREKGEVCDEAERLKVELGRVLGLTEKMRKEDWATFKATQHFAEDAMSDLFRNLEFKDRRVTHIAMDAILYAELRKWGRNALDIETRVDILRTGMMAKLWGVPILVSRKMGTSKVVIVSLDGTEEPIIMGYEVQIVPIEMGTLVEKMQVAIRGLDAILKEMA